MNDSDKLRAFAELIAIPLANTDSIKWPIRSGKIISYVNDIYACEFINDLKTMISTVPKEQWINAFYSSLSIWKISHHIINGFRKSELNNISIAQNILLMCDVLNEITHGNWLSSDSHIILPPTDIKNIYNVCANLDSVSNNALYPIVSAYLWAYSDTLFFQGREICCERHGLYLAESNKKLFITDLKNLDEAAYSLWPGTYEKMHIESIRVVSLYNSTFDMKIDPYNNTDLISGSFTESCCGGALIINGVVLLEPEILQFIDELAIRIFQQAKTVNDLSKEALIRQYINIFWYRKKRLSSIVNSDWMPKPEIFQMIDVEAIESEMYTSTKVLSYESQVKKYDFSKYI